MNLSQSSLHQQDTSVLTSLQQTSRTLTNLLGADLFRDEDALVEVIDCLVHPGADFAYQVVNAQAS